MTLDNVPFALFGGLLIGLSATLLLLFNGRIAGACGVLAGAILPGSPDRLWRWCFVGGILLGTALWHVFSGADVPAERGVSPLLIIAAGLLVGVGSQLANGCTSGHAVCGIGRLSPRSIVATLLFMGAGFVTVAIVRHGLGG